MKQQKKSSATVALAVGCLIAVASGLALEASASTWKGGAEGLWSDAGNWDGGVPANNGEAVFTKSVRLTDETSPTVKTLKFTGDGGYVLEGPTINFSNTALIQNLCSSRVTIKNNIVFTHNAWEGGQLSGSLQFDGTVTASSGYTMYQNNKYFDVIFNGKVDLGGGSFYLDCRETLQFNAPGNKFSMYAYNAVTVTAGCEGAFDSSSKFLQFGHASGNFGKIDLGGYNQALSRLKPSAANGSVTSASDAVLTLALEEDDTNNNVVFQGKAGVMLDADGKTLTLNGVSTSTGSLGVHAGTLQVPGSWKSASLLKVDGGRFEISHGNTVGSETAVEITDGVLSVADGVTESVQSLKIGGQACVAGVWGSAESGVQHVSEYLSGKGTLIVLSNIRTTARWTAAGGAATGLSVAENWEGNKTPDLVSGGLTPLFDAGSVATIDAPLFCEGISVTANTTDFSFVKDGNNGISILANGLSVEAGISARTVTFEAPLTVLQPQKWTVAGAADVLKVSGGISGTASAEISFTGVGKLALENAVDYTGMLVFMPTKQSALSFGNVDFAGSLHVGNKSAGSSLNHRFSLTGANVIHGKAEFRDWTNLAASYGSRLVFEGGVYSHMGLYVIDTGTYVVTNKPLGSAASSQTWFSDSANRTELWAATNLMSFVHYNRSELHCKTPHALASNNTVQLGLSAYDVDRRGKLFIEGDQMIGGLSTYPAASGSGAQPIQSECLSVLTVSNPTSDKDVYAEFLGGASFRFASVDGGNRTYAFHKASSSTGIVEVVGGTVDFVAPHAEDLTCSVSKKVFNIKFEGGSWTNASRVIVGGDAVAAKAVLNHGKVFGKKTVVDMRTNGTLDLAFGGTARVGELWINGVRQSDGIWGSAASGAPNQADCLGGTGLLRVGKVGMCLSFR